jgi:hypothetical protein
MASGEGGGGGYPSIALLREEATAAASREGFVRRQRHKRVGGNRHASQLRTLCPLRHVSSLHGHTGRETSVGGDGGVSGPAARGNSGVSLL